MQRGSKRGIRVLEPDGQNAEGGSAEPPVKVKARERHPPPMLPPAGEASVSSASASLNPEVTSLSPTPGSPPVARVAPTQRPSGKTKEKSQSRGGGTTSPSDPHMSAPHVSRATSQDERDNMDRPKKRMKLVNIVETIHRKVILEGRVIREERIQRSYWKRMDVSKYLP